MAQQVIEAFGLDLERLRDAALELQVVETCRYDNESTDVPGDPYLEFLYLAGLFCFDNGASEYDGSLLGLTHQQVYLACAWNYLNIAGQFAKDAVGQTGVTDDTLADRRRYAEGARQLIEDALGTPSRCVPCGICTVRFSAMKH